MRRITSIDNLTDTETEIADVSSLRFYVGEKEWIEIRYHLNDEVTITSGRNHVLTVKPKASNMIVVTPDWL